MEIKAEHEDLIWKNREFIKELSNVQELYYNTLVQELNLTERIEGLLFDFIYNDDGQITFEEYLSNYTNPDEKIYMVDK